MGLGTGGLDLCPLFVVGVYDILDGAGALSSGAIKAVCDLIAKGLSP